MTFARKKPFRVLLTAAAVAVISVALLYHSSRSESVAAPRPKCSNTACVSFCWTDGTVHNPGTKAVKKSPTPIECGNSNGGCITQSC